MALLTWSAKYSVQVKKFDDQHKKLIDIVNNLHDAMKVGKGKDTLGEVLEALITYTGNHFSEEEKAMKAGGFPGYEEHKKEHNLLVLQVKDIQSQFRSGKAVLTQEVMSFLKKWLEDHILGSDRNYGPFFNQQGIS
jgi:hemerythrin